MGVSAIFALADEWDARGHKSSMPAVAVAYYQAAAELRNRLATLPHMQPAMGVSELRESAAGYIDRLGERIRRGMTDLRRFGAHGSFGTYMDDLAAEAIAYAAALPHMPPAGEAVVLTLGQRAVARELLICCESWEPNVCVMGNVRAKDAADLLRFVLATPPQPSVQQEAQGGGGDQEDLCHV